MCTMFLDHLQGLKTNRKFRKIEQSTKIMVFIINASKRFVCITIKCDEYSEFKTGV